MDRTAAPRAPPSLRARCGMICHDRQWLSGRAPAPARGPWPAAVRPTLAVAIATLPGCPGGTPTDGEDGVGDPAARPGASGEALRDDGLGAGGCRTAAL